MFSGTAHTICSLVLYFQTEFHLIPFVLISFLLISFILTTKASRNLKTLTIANTYRVFFQIIDMKIWKSDNEKTRCKPLIHITCLLSSLIYNMYLCLCDSQSRDSNSNELQQDHWFRKLSYRTSQRTSDVGFDEVCRISFWFFQLHHSSPDFNGCPPFWMYRLFYCVTCILQTNRIWEN